jgi:hypothetical protein
MILPNGQVYVDNSLLKTVACETRVAMRHGYGYTSREEAIAAFCGQVVHEVLADHLRGKDIEWCRNRLRFMYKGYSDEYIPDDKRHRFYRLRYENVDAIVHEWLTQWPKNSLPFAVNPNLIEVGFQIPLSTECVCGHDERNHAAGGCQWRAQCGCQEFLYAFIFYGRYDGIVTAEHDHSLYVLDHKTTGRLTPYKVEEYRNDSQMSGYVWAARETTGQDIVGVYINAIELSTLPSDPVRKCREHGVVYAECGPLHMKAQFLAYTRDAEQLDQWHRTAMELARRYKAIVAKAPELENVGTLLTEGAFYGSCLFCDFKDFCAAGRPLNYVDNLLVYSPWRPFDTESQPAAPKLKREVTK